MFNTVPKRIGWFCLLCVVIIGGWFTVKILMPSLAATPATVPVWKIQVTPWGASQQVAFTPDGKQVFDLYDNYLYKAHGLKHWDVASGKELPPIKSQQDFVLLSKNGMYYTTADNKEKRISNLRVYRISDQKQIAAIPDLSKRGNIVEILGKKPLIVTFDIQKTDAKKKGSIQRSYSFWDVENKHFLHPQPQQTTIYGNYSIRPIDVAFSDDGSKVLSLWPVFTQTDKDKPSQFVEGLEPWPDSMNQKPKEAWLLNELNGKVIKLPFSKTTSGFQFTWDKPALSPDETVYASVSTTSFGAFGWNGEDGTIWCYDLPHRTLRWKYFKSMQGPDNLVFSPDGAMLAVGGYDYGYSGTAGYLSVIDTKTGNLIHDFTEQTLPQQISDRTRKFITDKAYNISFLKKRFGKSTERYYRDPPPGNSGLPVSLSWSPDSKMLAAAYADGSLKLWRVNE
jgi:WD40 repeat protein